MRARGAGWRRAEGRGRGVKDGEGTATEHTRMSHGDRHRCGDRPEGGKGGGEVGRAGGRMGTSVMELTIKIK